jgi:replication factor C small subunit
VFRREADESLPWVEKYRPKSLKEIMGHQWIVDALTNFVQERKIPHMIFTGPAGTGKTSAAISLVRDLLGSDFSPDQILELNASDNVRMETVQNAIKEFTESKSFSGGAAFKLIILDESDNIPKEPQQALRRIIEKCPANIKFIFMCNYENRLIDPIKSRCALFRFTPLSRKAIFEKLKEICKAENCHYTDNFYYIIYFISGGDMRKAINLLQMASTLEIKSEADYSKLYLISGFLPPIEMGNLQKNLRGGKFLDSVKLIQENRGFSGRNFLLQLTDWINSEDINIEKKAKIIEGIAEIDYRITTGSEQDLQLQSTLSFIIEILTAK